ncbi:hypothetical protein CF326_g8446 [Tilletia indica]|nr:hypothetical protein CF326_g8446 [Tilletia indica]
MRHQLRLVPLPLGAEQPISVWNDEDEGQFFLHRSLQLPAESSSSFRSRQVRFAFSHGAFSIRDVGAFSTTRVNGIVLVPGVDHQLQTSDFLEFGRPSHHDFVDDSLCCRVDITTSSTSTFPRSCPSVVHPPNSAPGYARWHDLARSFDQIFYDDPSYNPRAHAPSFVFGPPRITSSATQSFRSYASLVTHLRTSCVDIAEDAASVPDSVIGRHASSHSLHSISPTIPSFETRSSTPSLTSASASSSLPPTSSSTSSSTSVLPSVIESVPLSPSTSVLTSVLKSLPPKSLSSTRSSSSVSVPSDSSTSSPRDRQTQHPTWSPAGIVNKLGSLEVTIERVRRQWIRARSELLDASRTISSAVLASTRVLHAWRAARSELQELAGAMHITVPSDDPVRARRLLRSRHIIPASASRTSAPTAVSTPQTVLTRSTNARGHSPDSIAFSHARSSSTEHSVPRRGIASSVSLPAFSSSPAQAQRPCSAANGNIIGPPSRRSNWSRSYVMYGCRHARTSTSAATESDSIQPHPPLHFRLLPHPHRAHDSVSFHSLFCGRACFTFPSSSSLGTVSFCRGGM